MRTKTKDNLLNENSLKDRAAGSIVGALIGDALGLGPHWYYDLAQLREQFGTWIDGYTDPKPGRYHEGLKAGNLSQSGLITLELLRSIVDNNGYDEADFTRRLDDQFLQQIDGSPNAGPGGFTTNISDRRLASTAVSIFASLRDYFPFSFFSASLTHSPARFFSVHQSARI